MTNEKIIVILFIVEKGETMKEKLEDFEKQHKQNYYDAVVDTIHDNTEKLVKEELLPLFQDPPLASMDTLKSTILKYAKAEKIVLSLEQLQAIIHRFRDQMMQEVMMLGTVREESLHPFVEHALLEEKQKKEVISASQLKQTREVLMDQIKTELEYHLQEGLIPFVPQLLDENKNQSFNENDAFLTMVSEYLTYRYPSYMVKKIEDKMIFKDHTLMSRLMEHAERYQFTQEHSRLLDDRFKESVSKKDKRS